MADRLPTVTFFGVFFFLLPDEEPDDSLDDLRRPRPFSFLVERDFEVFFPVPRDSAEVEDDELSASDSEEVGV